MPRGGADNGELFRDDALIRRVHRESVVGLFGPRALLMQAAHPLAYAGLMAHTKGLDDPYERLARTGQIMDTIAFGRRADIDRAMRRVRALHRRTRGTLDEPAGRFAAGTPYAADDPDLLLWVLATLVDSALLVYGRYVGHLDRDDRDAYWQDYRRVGRLFGLRAGDMPRRIEDFDEYMRAMVAGRDLAVSDEARELAIDIVMRPPVPLHLRPLVEMANFVTVGLLPARLRAAFGFGWDPARGLVLNGGAEYVKRVLVPLMPERVRLVRSARAA